ncbi:NitT/TauT family transport system permease protein [Candidatus Methanophagaceae archaeon]|nr:NitT/TauT family transport system permease protein [Methanophagales archaeon]
MLKNRLLQFLNRRGVVEVISLGVAILIWELVAVFVIKDKGILPSPHAVFLAYFELLDLMPMDICTSLLHFAIGLGAGAVVGIAVGMLMGWFKTANRALDAIIEVLRPIPPLAWIPFAIIWIGLTHSAAGFIVFIGAVFPILINTYTGFREVDKTYIDAAKVLGCEKESKLIRLVAIPFSLPYIATGIRVGMGVGWMCLVAAEYFGVSRYGLGHRLLCVFFPLQMMDRVVAYMILLGLIALVLDRVFRYFVEERLLKWKKGMVTQ